MLCLTKVAVSILLIICNSYADICVSNRVGSSSVVNGYYEENGITLGKPDYKMTHSSTCGGTFYMFYQIQQLTERRWWIGPDLGGPTYWARCSVQTDTPQQCQSWAFPDPNTGQNIIDTSVIVTNGTCPKLLCDAIQITGSSSSVCDGIFNSININGTDNAYYNSDTDRYWYWYPEVNYWICAGTVERDCQPSVTAIGGNDINIFDQLSIVGSSITMNTQTGSTLTTATVECVNKSTTTLIPVEDLNATRNYTGNGLCLWNVVLTNASSVYNGYYAEIDYDENGKNYYEHITECNDNPLLYIYFVKSNDIYEFPTGSGNTWQGGWMITETPPQLSVGLATTNPLAWCPLPLSTSPMECDGEWRFNDDTDNGYSLYSSVTATNGECPKLNCSQLVVTSTLDDNPCVGIYYPEINQTNVYVNNIGLDNNYYWYFNPNAFYWVCNRGGYNKQCSVTINNGDYGPYGWFTSYPQFSFDSQYRNGTLTFQCYDTIPTAPPTIFPTQIPTIDPTQEPTVPPSNEPTSYPTNRPTTDMPTTPAPYVYVAIAVDEPTSPPTDGSHRDGFITACKVFILTVLYIVFVLN